MNAALLVHVQGAARSYGSGSTATVALQETTCAVAAGARIGLVGPSGSGKSTLLHLMGGLDEPTIGTVSWPAIGDRSDLRPGPVAMVFQGPSLLPPLSVAENVALPLILGGLDDEPARDAASAALERLGLSGLADKLPEEISGGQSQRVAIARALAGAPRLILADEPTGQLDHASAEDVVDVLISAANQASAALVIATHDPAVAGRMADRWELHSGRLELMQEARTWSS